MALRRSRFAARHPPGTAASVPPHEIVVPECGDRLGPFRLLDRIGEGGSSLVYSAVDASSGSVYALKLLLNPTDLGIDRLKRGFRAIADLYHPNLVSLDRLHFASLTGRESSGREPSGTAAAQKTAAQETAAQETAAEERIPRAGHGYWFVTMELIHGSDLASFIRGKMAEDRETRFEWLADLIRQIGAALSALHARSLVHRDIKPSNFLIEASGRLRLLDYGLVGSFEPWFGRESESPYLAGTLPYMAPEVLIHRIYPPASDIYSVGRVVLELLCGELPATDREAGEDPQEWERQNAARLPSELPEPLRELCASMLEFDPSERPTAWDLERFERREAGAADLPTWVREHPLPPIGRDAEVAAVCRWIHEVIRGQGGSMHLSGPPGIGKTVLLGEVVQAARSEWIEVYRARCRQREALPLRAFDEPINGIARWIASGSCGPLCLSEGERRAIAALFPILAPALLPPAGELEPPRPKSSMSTSEGTDTVDETQRRQDALDAVVQLFGSLCEQTPILLVIDDLQWADADSIALLRRLMTKPPPRLGILTASRPEFAAHDLPLEERLELSGVSPASACTILCNCARRRGLEISEARALELAKEADGNPYLLTHIGDLLGADGTAVTDFDGLWAIRRRRLSPPARLMLELLAVAGRPVDVGHLIAITQAASREESEASSGASPLPATVLVELRHEMLARDFGPEAATVEMYHDRITEAVIRSAGEETCRGHHRRWARWLAALDDPPSAEIARHWIAGGRASAAVEHAIRAANAARERLAFAESARWYAWAAEHLAANPDDSAAQTSTELLQAAADCYATSGRSGRAAELYERLAEGDAGEGELRFRRFAAEHYIRAGLLAKARRTIADVAPRLKLPPLRSPLATQLTILWNLLRLRALGPIDPAAEGRSPDPRQFERIDTLLNICRGMSLFDSLYTGSLITAGMLLAARHGDRRRMLHASIAYAVISSYDAGRGREQANRLLPAIMKATESFHEPKLTADGLSAVGCGLWVQARWAEAVGPLLDAHLIYRNECSGCIFESVHLHWQALWAQFFLGRIHELARTRDWIQQDAADRDDALAWLTSVCGISAAGGLALDRVDEFRAADRRLRANYRGLGFQLIHMFRLISATTLDSYAGRPAAAWRRLRAHDRAYRKSAFSGLQIVRVQWQWMHVHIATCMATALNAGSSPRAQGGPTDSRSPTTREDWLELAEKWLTPLRRERMEFAETLSQFAAGQIAELRGDRETARAMYEQTINSAARQQLELYRLAAGDRLTALCTGRAGTGLADYLAAEGVRKPAAFARILAVPLDRAVKIEPPLLSELAPR